MDYHSLLQSATASGIDVYEKVLSLKTKGLYGDNVIWINRTLSSVEKTCTLAEELGHHFTTYGNILDQTKLKNRKQELRAREWGYKLLFPLERLIDAQKEGIRNRFELAEYLNVTEQFLEDALKRYKEKYGLYKQVGKHTICFEPLGVIENFEEVMPK
ncbi:MULTISPECIES: ImmA/IrrE family metallo-endopeptidase [Bacillus]|uniref:ImmA/IrrE family metallo-endopeptidase n=1 Tax=Bacillus TaxID=1386 RepID=UPI001FAD583F|nr:ImmA/IrrE family metallo-endopeptidase [Bacillus altitudinis]MCI9883857.1 ImmA/IrrE family metallo-endopeptidase [Bacillus altitudinis]MEC3814895.1 ImmA/IrrE family metallo-endopeptidase [Bacillus altitudinis]WOQ72361.1 ImmA/IrrE family metallo-endopeptidase [Bacillus stratosphericus]